MEATMIVNIMMLLAVGGIVWFVKNQIPSHKKHINNHEKKPDFGVFDKRRVS
jgi:hypothetical protein